MVVCVSVPAAVRFGRTDRPDDNHYLWHSASVRLSLTDITDALQQCCKRLTWLLSVVVCRPL